MQSSLDIHDPITGGGQFEAPDVELLGLDQSLNATKTARKTLTLLIKIRQGNCKYPKKSKTNEKILQAWIGNTFELGWNKRKPNRCGKDTQIRNNQNVDPNLTPDSLKRTKGNDSALHPPFGGPPTGSFDLHCVSHSK